MLLFERLPVLIVSKLTFSSLLRKGYLLRVESSSSQSYSSCSLAFDDSYSLFLLGSGSGVAVVCDWEYPDSDSIFSLCQLSTAQSPAFKNHLFPVLPSRLM